jgi:hypothetical protein
MFTVSSLADPKKHWFQQLWPGAKGWPRKYMFHAMKLVTESLNQGGVDPETVIDVMMRKKAYRKKIPNRIMDPTKLHNKGMDLFNRFQNLDEEKAQEKKVAGQSYKRTFLPDRPGERRGTYRTFMNFLDHNNKGCYRDLLPMNKMCYPISKDTNDEVRTQQKEETIYTKNELTKLFVACRCFSLLILYTAVVPLK